MKKWWREWAFLDFVAIGIALLLIILNLLSERTIEPEAAILNLIPNLATEVIGVWISIRIIERILRKRDIFHGNRSNLFWTLSSLGELQKKMFPSPYKWRANSLVEQGEYCRKLIEDRNKFFYKDEVEQITKCLDCANSTYEKIRHFFDIDKNIAETNVLIELKEIETNSKREKVRYDINCITNLGFIATGENGVPIGGFLKNLQESTALYQGCFVEEDYDFIIELLKYFEKKDLITYDDVVIIPNEGIKEATKSLFSYGSDWYKMISYAIKIINNLSDINDTSWIPVLESAEKILDKNPDKYSKEIVDLAKLWAKQVNNLGESAIQIISNTNKYLEYLYEVRSNIGNETPLD